MRYRSAFTAADCNSLCKLQSPRLASIGVGTARANHLDYIALLRSVPDFVSRPVAGKRAGLGGGGELKLLQYLLKLENNFTKTIPKDTTTVMVAKTSCGTFAKRAPGLIVIYVKCVLND